MWRPAAGAISLGCQSLTLRNLSSPRRPPDESFRRDKTLDDAPPKRRPQLRPPREAGIALPALPVDPVAEETMSSAALVVCLMVVGQSSPRVLTPPGPEIGPDYVLPRATWVYEPPYFDCYSRHRKWLDCYPGFHEIHYRRPYNYRVLFDYPWHEDVHGPMPNGGHACREVWIESAAGEVPLRRRSEGPLENARWPQPAARRAVYLER
jgi:hypothetical protein